MRHGKKKGMCEKVPVKRVPMIKNSVKKGSSL